MKPLSTQAKMTSSQVSPNATPSMIEQAQQLMEQQKRGVPLFGKGSGRGRKKCENYPLPYDKHSTVSLVDFMCVHVLFVSF